MFNADGRYNGTYPHEFETLTIIGDMLTVQLHSIPGLPDEAGLRQLAADLAGHYEMGTDLVENDLYQSRIPAQVDTARPGTVLPDGTVRLWLRDDA